MCLFFSNQSFAYIARFLLIGSRQEENRYD